MKFQLWQPLLLLLYAMQLADATQVFPQTYEFLSRDYSVRFSEPEATCPDVVMKNGQNFTVCYYDSEIRPKLMDCDLGEGTYQDGGAYPLLHSGTIGLGKKYEFRFTFDPTLIFSSFTLHYHCSRNLLRIGFTHDLSTMQSSPGLTCGNGHQTKRFTESETPNQNVTVTFIIPPVFRGQEGGIFLSEVQFFRGGSVPADPCPDHSCCANEAVCHVNSTVPNGYECECLDGFSGVNCQFRICTSLPCQNGGTCIDNLEDYNCACPPGYTGKQCEVILAKKETTLAMHSTAHLAVTSSVLASQPSDRSGSSSLFATAAAAAGAVVLVFVVILIILGFGAVVVYCRRKKGKKSRKVIEHIGEDESNIYALVDKPRKKRNAPPTVPLQNFDPMVEGLDRKETPPPAGHNDPSTGQASNFQPVHANTHHDPTDPQEQSPPSCPLTDPPGNTCDTVDFNSPDSKCVGQASDCEESCDQPVTDVYAVVDKKEKVAKHHPPRPPPYAGN